MKVHHVLAPNPGLFTGIGTNTWVVESSGAALVIDPGPMDPSHLDAVAAKVRDLDLAAVLVTHTHPDHAPGANEVGARFEAEVAGFGPGPGFSPDRLLADGDTVAVGDLTIDVVHTPGHTPDHLCFAVNGLVFSGDHVLGGTTVIVEHMSDYLESLERLIAMKPTRIYPGHGPIIDKPMPWLRYYVEHRRARERSILDALSDGARSIGEIVEHVYVDVAPGLHYAAAMSVGAHLRKLHDEGLVELPMGSDDWEAPVLAKGAEATS